MVSAKGRDGARPFYQRMRAHEKEGEKGKKKKREENEKKKKAMDVL